MPETDVPSVETAVHALLRPDGRTEARRLLQEVRPPLRPGLYSWWVDAVGAEMLTRELRQSVESGLVYAGQAGATRWPSGKRSPASLATRISAGHLGHSIDGSTFRLTLAAVLHAELGLEMRTSKYLTRESEKALTEWMAEHLAVAWFPVDEAAGLAELERAVLQHLDPPLNLEGMPKSDVRSQLSALRRELRGSSVATRVARKNRIGLVGCVKTKGPGRAQAGELYRSALFLGRRAAAESSCGRWFILSAKHGLVSPSRRIAPYDVTLTRARVRERARWSHMVLRQIEDELGPLAGLTFEIHAGAAYADYGLEEGLLRAGANVVRPTAGMSFGAQLAYYRRKRLGVSPPPRAVQ